MSNQLPEIVRGVYVSIAGTDVPDSLDYQPQCGDWIKQFNVVWLTFLDWTLKVPPSMVKASKNRGSDGLNVASGTKVLYSIGGAAYTENKAEKWTCFTTSAELAIETAKDITNNPDYQYIDGIDIDIEAQTANNSTYLLDFLREVRKNKPNWIITQPVDGASSNYKNNQGKLIGVSQTIVNWYPNINWFKNFNNLPNVTSFTPVPDLTENRPDKNLYDSIGLMGYVQHLGDLSKPDTDTNIFYRNAYSGIGTSNCASQWNCNIPCAVPFDKIILGISTQNIHTNQDVEDILELARKKQIRGYMIWYARPDNNKLNYAENWNIVTHLPNINWKGKNIFYSCTNQGFGCSEDQSCQTEDNQRCFSDIQNCNTTAKCGPFYSCKNPKQGCEKNNCDLTTDKNCFSDLDTCNHTQNCINYYKCNDKDKGCEIDSKCTFNTDGCYENQIDCIKKQNCSPPLYKCMNGNECKIENSCKFGNTDCYIKKKDCDNTCCLWYQTGQYPNCKNPLCIETFNSIKKSKTTQIIIIVLVLSVASQFFSQFRCNFMRIIIFILVLLLFIFMLKTD